MDFLPCVTNGLRFKIYRKTFFFSLIMRRRSFFPTKNLVTRLLRKSWKILVRAIDEHSGFGTHPE